MTQSRLRIVHLVPFKKIARINSDLTYLQFHIEEEDNCEGQRRSKRKRNEVEGDGLEEDDEFMDEGESNGKDDAMVEGIGYCLG